VNARRALPWVGIVAGLVLLAVIVGSPRRDDGVLFGPESTAPLGTRGLVLLIESFGAEVVVSPDVAPGTDVVLVLRDVLADERIDELARWVADGHTLVVADPISRLSAPVSGDESFLGLAPPTVSRGTCTIDALAGAASLVPQSGVRYEVERRQSCFGDGDRAFVVAEPRGDGTIVSIGAANVFVNDVLGEADNAALATSLLAPSPGTRVTVIPPQVIDTEGTPAEDRSLLDVMAPGAQLAIVQLFLAFVAYAWFRARRLGRPVSEPLPVAISGSELVVAVGNLLQQQRSPDRAAVLLRRDLRRRLAERLGLSPQATAEVVADVAADRTAVDRARIYEAVADRPVGSDAALMELARSIDDIRKEILHGH
jgi:hypothetical protein